MVINRLENLPPDSGDFAGGPVAAGRAALFQQTNPRHAMNDAKPILLSRTFWLNAVTLGLAVLAALAGHEWVSANPKWSACIASIVAALNIALRLLTDRPATLTGPE